MSISLQDLHETINRELSVSAFQDYCPNGLQVQGVPHINKLVAGVTASQQLIDCAVDEGADALLVHHGFFWKGEDPCLVGVKYQRIAKLIENGISLLAYHLPLDAHSEWGNNAQLAKLLNFSIEGGLQDVEYPIGLVGRLPKPMRAAELSAFVAKQLAREPLVIAETDKTLETVAWCTGAAQSYIEQAAAKGADVFISGEISEPTVHLARELGITYFAAGHHATERYGVKALGEAMARRFTLDFQFIDCDNPV